MTFTQLKTKKILSLLIITLPALNACDFSADSLVGRRPLAEPEARINPYYNYCATSAPRFDANSKKPKACEAIGFSNIVDINANPEGTLTITLANSESGPESDDNVSLPTPSSTSTPTSVPSSTSGTTTQADAVEADSDLTITNLELYMDGIVDSSADLTPKDIKTIPMTCVRKPESQQFICSAPKDIELTHIERTNFARYRIKQIEIVSQCGAITTFKYDQWASRQCDLPKPEGELLAESAPLLFLQRK
jgi:hypothetical protein